MSAPEPGARRHPLCEHFLGWQCRVRQMALRQGGGRPSAGMRPAVKMAPGRGIAAINVLILKQDLHEHTARFRHIVKRTHDPAERYHEAVRELSAAYYQRPQEFSDVMTALFALDSPDAVTLAADGRCELIFEQYSQRYDLPCAVWALPPADPAYQATFWHNSMFNPTMPGRVSILAFAPDWAAGRAEPPVERAS